MGKTKDLSAFEQGGVVGARHTGLSVSRTAMLLVFNALQFPVYLKNGPPHKGYAANSRSVVKNGSLMKEAKVGSHKLCRATDGLQ